MSQSELAERFPDEVLELQSLLKKANRENPTTADRVELARFLERHPNVWRYVGDLMDQATLNLIHTMPGSAVTQETLTAAVAHLPNELTLPGDGVLESMLIQNIVLCWLRLAYVEYLYTSVTLQEGQTTARIEHWEGRLNAAQRRYLRAIESLSRVRKLSIPAMQLNIGQQQVNQIKQ